MLLVNLDIQDCQICGHMGNTSYTEFTKGNI